MKWSWPIGRVRDIELRVHATFLFLLAWLAIVYYREGGTAAAAIGGVIFTLALFGSVVLHELGHALVARRFGVPTRDITLLPIGGVARLEYIPDKPKQELAIALAGPAVTLAIAVVLGGLLLIAGVPLISSAATGRAGSSVSASMFLVQLMWVNVSLLVFNLLPAFPMDGGRVLRAALALRGDYARATETASRVGRAFALLFGIIGLMYNPILVLIALFVWLGAAAEAGASQEHVALAGVSVERVMIREVSTLAPTDTLDAALHHVLEGFQHDFPVVDADRVVGMLTRAALLEGLGRRGVSSSVAESMDTSFSAAAPNEPVVRALARLRECHCQTSPVVQNGRLCGVLNAENVAEFVMIGAALRKAPPAHPRPGIHPAR
jgi:Zn-dependent protease/predicted transcriptional regulator